MQLELMPPEPQKRSTGPSPEDPPIEGISQLVENLAAGCKPPDEFRLGVEQEKFVFRSGDLRPAAYEGDGPGIRDLLEGMMQFGWKPVFEDGRPVALAKGGSAITLEPGGQVEFAGTARDSVHETEAETRTHYEQLSAVARELGLSILAIGHQPIWPRRELPWMPKERYRIMRGYMPRRGSQGLDMMQSTCALQVSFDFSSEADMVKKFRVALALQPLAVALFANSPFTEGQRNGFLSIRNHIWNDTDPDRCGGLPFVFEEGMGFERYIDYILDVPMYFVIRDGRHIDASGLSFREFLDGRLPVMPGELPLLSDWENHLSTVFPDVRLKQFLELRGADAGDSVPRVSALPALWAGILYDGDSLEAAWERIRQWSPDEREELRRESPRHGFRTPFRDGTVRDLCLWMLNLSREGLRRRNRRNAVGRDESIFLDPLQEVAESGETFAEDLIRRFESEWNEDIDVAVRDLCEETML